MSDNKSMARRIDVTVVFRLLIESDAPQAYEIGRELCDHIAYAGNPLRAPYAVEFIQATEGCEHQFGEWFDDPGGVVRECALCGEFDWRPEG